MDQDICRLTDCDLPVKIIRDQLCSAHSQQFRNGRPFTTPRRSSLERDELGRKLCRRCRAWKRESDFKAENRSADGFGPYCRSCVRLYEVERRESKRDRIRERDMNMTRAQFDAMFESQGSACAICRTTETGYHFWCVDHDHRCCPMRAKSCGSCIRGILCSSCNKAIGLLGDSPELLERAAEYVKAGWHARAARTRGAR